MRLHSLPGFGSVETLPVTTKTCCLVFLTAALRLFNGLLWTIAWLILPRGPSHRREKHWEMFKDEKIRISSRPNEFMQSFSHDISIILQGLFAVSISTHSWLLLPFFLPTQCVFPLQRFSKWRGVMIRQLAVTGGDALFKADEWHWNIHDITKEIYSSKYQNTNMQAIC